MTLMGSDVNTRQGAVCVCMCVYVCVRVCMRACASTQRRVVFVKRSCHSSHSGIPFQYSIPPFHSSDF